MPINAAYYNLVNTMSFLPFVVKSCKVSFRVNNSIVLETEADWRNPALSVVLFLDLIEKKEYSVY
jgi:hypothetical protein